MGKRIPLWGLISAGLLTLILAACQNPLTMAEAPAEEEPWVDPTELNSGFGFEQRALTGPVGTNYPASGAFSRVNPAGWGTATWPQGSNFVSGEGSNLRIGVYSANATAVLLEVYGAATGQDASYDYWMVKGSDNIWRAEIASVPGKTLYAFRVWGPNWPYNSSWTRGNSLAGFQVDVDTAGNRFNPNKVLFDPYGLEMTHDKTTPAMVAAGHDGGMYGTGAGLYKGVARRVYDTARWAPKSIAFIDNTPFGTKPGIAEKDAIIYEAHVRGITQHASSSNLQSILSGIPGFEGVVNVPAELRGTYKGAAYLAPYLKALGINTIELLPIHETENDINPDIGSGGNFWGYMTYSYFAPDRRYSYDKTWGGPTKEFKEMVKAFHDAGIEVYIDVVYNHTGEGGLWGDANTAELTNFRGFDNQVYYALVGENKAFYWESTGCGNNFNTGHPTVSRLIKDSLLYYITKMGVDGFRFDLAPVLGRDQGPNYWYNPNAQLNLDIAAMTTTYNVEMIAEAWDISTYAVGTFPNKWGEWNGRYRDATRKFFKGDTSGQGGVSYADAFFGDYANFNDQGGASKSVNFIVAHDGFTLADLVSYNLKTNTARAWPFGTSDGGSDNNESWDSGGNQALRRQRWRNFMVWHMFSRGVPMIVYGDEFARTQNGNNNPYNLDSVATWNNYNQIASDSPHTVATGFSGEAYHNNFGTDGKADGKNLSFLFSQYVMNLRKTAPALRQQNYSMPIYFAKADGSGGFNAYSDRAVRIHIDGSAVGDDDYLLYVNNWTAQVSFNAPAADSGKKWIRLIDTSTWAETNNNVWTEANAWTLSGSYGVNPWSIVVFKAVNSSTAVIPDTPTGLSAVTASSSQINLSWNPSAGATTYTVLRSASSGGTYTSIGSTSGTTLSSTGLAAGTTYWYRVTAGNTAGTSPQSPAVSATTHVAAPGTPTGLTASAASSSQINLSWTAVANAASYTIFRATTSGGTYSQIGTSTTNSFANTGLPASTTYWYRVSASNAGGSSAQSTAVSATTQASSTVTTTIRVQYDTGFGNNMFVRGSLSPLSWTTGQAMTWTTGNVWVFTTTAIASGAPFEFKALINNTLWSDGGNFTGTGGSTITVTPTFHGNFYDVMDNIATNWSISGGTTTYKWHQGSGFAQARATSTISYLTQNFSMDKRGTNVTLAFKYKTVGLDTGEYLRVQVLNGTTWNTVATYTGTKDWTNVSLDITAHQSSAMRIRFASLMNATDEWVYVDNVSVSTR